MTYPVLFGGQTGQWIDFVVYGLVDPRTPELIRYVGQSIAPGGRYAQHVSVPPKVARRGRREVWVAEMRDAGVLPTMLLLERLDGAADLDAREEHWIAHFRALGQADLNGPLPVTPERRAEINQAIRTAHARSRGAKDDARGYAGLARAIGLERHGQR